MLREFYKSVSLLLLLNLLLKPIWVFLIDRKVQLLLGNEVFGNYFTLFNTTLIASVLLDNGTQVYYTLHKQIINIGQLIYIKLVWSFIFSIITLLLSVLITGTISLLAILIIIFHLCSAFVLLLRSHFSATQQFTLDSYFSITDKLVSTIVLSICIYFFPSHLSTTIFIGVQAIAALLLLLMLCIILANKAVLSFSSITFHKQLFYSLMPYTVLVLLMAILLRVDVLLLKILHPKGNTEVGKYALGYRLFDALNSFGFLIASFLFPFLVKNIANNKLIKQTTMQLRNILLLSTTLGVFIFVLFRHYFTYILYNSIATDVVYNIFFCLTAFIGASLVHIYGSLITAANHIKAFSSITAICILINIVLNAFFIPTYGSLACATILCFTQICYGIALWWYSKQKILR